ncbi:MAG: ATP-binding cassette domain-containing protein [Planctomycetes bacterium]|nr:ATP-binding cassette domain-containing protein [Planctomycetota bacterium]
MTDLALELRGVCKHYGDLRAVQEIDIAVPKGAIYGFLGPNGAGKTTTIRMILDIVKPTSGSIAVLGAPSALDVRNRIGYLPEEKGLYKKMKASSIIAYFARLKGVDKKTAKARSYELLEKYGLRDFADAKVETLSKGMGQKVQVLASIAHHPEFVILDEPFSGLDPVNQQVMEDVIKDMSTAGSTIIFSTHVMSHAERICDRILLIAKGRKIFDGTIAEAKKMIPNRVRLQVDATVDQLSILPGVLEVGKVSDDVHGDLWDLTIEEGADAQQILQTCFARGVKLRSFDHSEPTLHDVFVELVGDDAREAQKR